LYANILTELPPIVRIGFGAVAAGCSTASKPSDYDPADQI
jgi:hypothetical protein